MAEPVIIKVGADISELTAKLESLQSQFDEFKGTAKQSGEAVKQAFTGQAVQSTDKLTEAVRLLNQQLEHTKDPQRKAVIQGQIKALEQETVATKQLTTEVQKQGGQQQTLRQQMRQTREEMSRLMSAGKENTAEFQKLANTYGALKNKQDDIAGFGKALGSDTKYIDGAIQGVQGLVGAFSIFQGVQMLVGSENKEFQQAMLKMMATMQVLNGVQQVANILQKESALMQTINAAATKLRTKATTENTATIVANNAVVETSETAMSGASKAAGGMGAAIGGVSASGGILVVGMAALVAGVLLYSDYINSAAEDTEKFKKEIEDNSAAIDANAEKMIKLAEQIGGYRDKLRDTGLTESDLTEKNIDDLEKLANKQIKNWQDRIKIIEAEKKVKEEQIVQNQKLINSENTTEEARMAYLDNIKRLNIAIGEHNFRISQLNGFIKDSQTQLSKQSKELRENIKAEEDAAKAIKDSEEAEKKRKEAADRAREAYKNALKEWENLYYGQRNLLRKNIEDQENQLKKDSEYTINLKKTEIDEIERLDKQRTTDRKNYWDLVIQNTKEGSAENTKALLENEKIRYEQELKEKGNTADLIEQIELEHQNNINKIHQDASDKRLENIKKEAQQYVQFIQQALGLIMQYEQQRTNEKLQSINDIYDTETKKNQDALNKGLISQEQFDKKSQQLQDKKDKQEKAAKHKAFEQERTAKLIEAGINAAMVIVQAYTKDVTGVMALLNGLIVAGQIALIASAKNPYAKGTAQILSGNSHQGGGISLGQFGTAEGGEMLGILSKKNTKQFGKPMLELFDGINKGNDSKMLSGLSGLVMSAMPEIKTGNTNVTVQRQPELAEMLKIMQKEKEEITVIGNRKIIKKGNHTRIVQIYS